MKYSILKRRISIILAAITLFSSGYTVLAEETDITDDVPFPAEETSEDAVLYEEEEPFIETDESLPEAGSPDEFIDVEDADESEVLPDILNGKTRGTDGYYYFYRNGEIQTGWIKYDSMHYYYAGSDGRLYRNQWAQRNGSWYYFDDDSEMVSDKKISIYDSKNGTYDYYFFDEDGIMQTGWIQYDSYGHYYYAYSSGKLAIGWAKINKKWYYFDTYNCQMMTGKFSIYNSDTNKSDYYYSNSSGVLQTGWIKYDSKGNYYYATSDGKLVTGWKKINNKWYYFNDQYTMQKGMITIGGKKYYLKDGAMQTGWFQIENSYSWYYADSSGVLAKGWKKISNKWYYFRELDNTMVTGKYTIGNYDYYFNSSGVMQTGWIKPNPDSDYYYYADSNGHLYINKWLKSGGKWYYFDQYGDMVASYKKTIGGKVYYFNSDGSCQNP